MPRSDYIAKLQEAIRTTHDCESRHVTTVPVSERFRGEIAWQGPVEIFDLIGHQTATCCYAWGHEDTAGRPHSTTVLGVPPVDSAHAAVKVAIAAKADEARRIRNLILGRAN